MKWEKRRDWAKTLLPTDRSSSSPTRTLLVCIFPMPAPLHSMTLIHSLRSCWCHHDGSRIVLAPPSPTFVCRQAHTVCSRDAICEGLGTDGNFLSHLSVRTGTVVSDCGGTR